MQFKLNTSKNGNSFISFWQFVCKKYYGFEIHSVGNGTNPNGSSSLIDVTKTRVGAGLAT